MKSKETKLKTKAENLWKLAILKRDKKCQRCGSRDCLQAHHIISRRHSKTFFDLDNGILLCRKCHCWITYAHDEDRRDFHLAMRGEKYLNLYYLSKIIKVWTIKELEELIKGLTPINRIGVVQ